MKALIFDPEYWNKNTFLSFFLTKHILKNTKLNFTEWFLVLIQQLSWNVAWNHHLPFHLFKMSLTCVRKRGRMCGCAWWKWLNLFYAETWISYLWKVRSKKKITQSSFFPLCIHCRGCILQLSLIFLRMTFFPESWAGNFRKSKPDFFFHFVLFSHQAFSNVSRQKLFHAGTSSHV